MAWTEEMVEQLRKFWDEGLTTGEIGKRLGVSKNAVVGKARRLKLKSRPSPIKRKSEKVKKPPKKKKTVTELVDLNNRTCRWPIGDPKEKGFHFCGKEIPMGRIYCPEHSAVAYVAPAKKTNKNARRKHALNR